MRSYHITADPYFRQLQPCANCGAVLVEDADEAAGNVSALHLMWETGAVVLCIACVDHLIEAASRAIADHATAESGRAVKTEDCYVGDGHAIYSCGQHGMSDGRCCALAVEYREAPDSNLTIVQ